MHLNTYLTMTNVEHHPQLPNSCIPSPILHISLNVYTKPSPTTTQQQNPQLPNFSIHTQTHSSPPIFRRPSRTTPNPSILHQHIPPSSSSLAYSSLPWLPDENHYILNYEHIPSFRQYCNYLGSRKVIKIKSWIFYRAHLFVKQTYILYAQIFSCWILCKDEEKVTQEVRFVK